MMPPIPPFWWMPAHPRLEVPARKVYEPFCSHERPAPTPCVDSFCIHEKPHKHSVCPRGLRSCARLIVWPDGTWLAVDKGDKKG